ncbi:hypothetical protein FQN50_010018 [Emmonsiellopsis sp. PD_5]|nr:hypothetical protein FQN50_010018 [Emmonsiellopsis sp. PD_5]
MDALTYKSFTTTRSQTYTYYDSGPSSSKTGPALLLLHGFPDSADLYSPILPRLLPLPHRLIIPNLLGYAGTSKPTDPAAYTSKFMAADIAELLANESINQVIPIGHDWGSYMARSMYLWHPELVVGLGLLNVGYMAPDLSEEGRKTPFDLQVINAVTEKMVGYPIFAYWELLTAPEDGPAVLGAHVESLWTVMHGEKPGWMKELFCVRGAMREHLVADRRVEVFGYAKDVSQGGSGYKEAWVERMKKDGFAGPLCWYRALKENYNFEAERTLPADRAVAKCPVLFVGCSGDSVCREDAIQRPKELGLLPDLTVKSVQAAHWSLLENPKDMGEAIVGFLKEKFPA